MKKRITLPIVLLALWLGAATSCGTARRSTAQPAPGGQTTAPLAPELQRKYDYFFLEAMRLKEKKEYTAAFELLKRCLDLAPDAPSALFEIAQYYMVLNQPELGLATLEKAAANAPDNYWYNQGLATLYMQQDQPDKAAAQLEQMAQRFPDKLEPLFNLLDLYGRQEKFDQMIGILNQVEQRMGKSEQLSMEKFRIYIQTKDTSKAIREIESLIHEYPAETRYRVILGDVYLQNGKPEQAYDIYRKVLDEEPDDPMALYSLASYYDQTGQDSLYRLQIDTLLLNAKVEPQVKLDVMRQVIIDNEQAKGDSTQVIALFRRVMATDEDDPQMPMLFAQYLLTKNMPQEAMPVLEKVVELDPANNAARLMIVSEAARKEDFNTIIKVCQPGIEATPDALELYYYLALAYSQAQQTDSVLNVCRGALQRVTPESPKEMVSDFYAIMGDVYHQKGKEAETYAAYDSALVYNPSNITALNNYAYYLALERRELDRAEEMSYKTVKAEPDNATFLDTYAWILFVKGRYEEARVYIDNAMKADKEKSSEVVEHCGDIYYMLGETERAVEYWKEALQIGSESEVLKEKIRLKKYIAP